MALIEITDEGIEAIQRVDPQSSEGRFLTTLEQAGPSKVEDVLPGLTPQQHRQVVKSFTDAGLIEVTQEASMTVKRPPERQNELPKKDNFSIVSFPEVKLDTEVRIPDLKMEDVRIPDLVFPPLGSGTDPEPQPRRESAIPPPNQETV